MDFFGVLRPRKTINDVFDDLGYHKPPGRPAKWLLFLIALAIATLVIVIFNVASASAATTYIFQQQDTALALITLAMRLVNQIFFMKKIMAQQHYR